MTNNIFVLKGDLNGENRSGAFLFFFGYMIAKLERTLSTAATGYTRILVFYSGGFFRRAYFKKYGCDCP